MAGLLAARALTETYERVTIVERDTLPTGVAHRRGVPQSRHTHGLLYRGREILEELFPGLSDDVVADGAIRGDIQQTVRWCNAGRTMRQAPSGLTGLALSRPLLEAHVRARVTALDGIRVLREHDAVSLSTTPDRRRVIGVRVRGTGAAASLEATDHQIRADLVVDASGRGTRSPQWLRELGYAPPPRDELHVAIAYMTRRYRRAAHHLDGDYGVIIAGTPANSRSGVMLAQEDDQWIVTLVGYLGDVPPPDAAGFAAFAGTLPNPDIHSVISTAEPVDDPRPTRYPSSVRHRYERLRELPEGFLVFGDAICTFNPIYGQGMTVAATEALVLRDCLARGTDRLARRFFRRVAKVVDIPWDIVVGGDLRFPAVEGRRTLKVRAVNAYLARLHVAAASDPAVGLAFLTVANLARGPQRLLAPDVAARVVRGNWGRRPTGTRTAVPSAR